MSQIKTCCKELMFCTAPVLISGPQSQTVDNGVDATFSVTASGTALQYDWYKDGVPILDEHSSSFTIIMVDDPDEGTYTVRVYNDCGTVTSAGAVLTVGTFTCGFFSDIANLVWGVSPQSSAHAPYQIGYLNGAGATAAGGFGSYASQAPYNRGDGISFASGICNPSTEEKILTISGNFIGGEVNPVMRGWGMDVGGDIRGGDGSAGTAIPPQNFVLPPKSNTSIEIQFSYVDESFTARSGDFTVTLS